MGVERKPPLLDKERLKNSARKEKNERETEIADLKAVMVIPEGRRLMWRIINGLCHYDTLSAQFSSGSGTYFYEGERNVGRILKGEVYEVAFEEYQKMEAEHMKKMKEKEAENG